MAMGRICTVFSEETESFALLCSVSHRTPLFHTTVTFLINHKDIGTFRLWCIIFAACCTDWSWRWLTVSDCITSLH
jgi:hypothetical protein